MSVIGYSHREIVSMLAASWCHGSIGSRDGVEMLERYAEAGNRISAANDQAYVRTYQSDTQVMPETQRVTALEVKGGIIGLTNQKQLEGFRVLDGIRYNLVANDGTDYATAEILDDLLMFFRARIRRYELRESSKAS